MPLIGYLLLYVNHFPLDVVGTLLAGNKQVGGDGRGIQWVATPPHDWPVPPRPCVLPHHFVSLSTHSPLAALYRVR